MHAASKKKNLQGAIEKNVEVGQDQRQHCHVKSLRLHLEIPSPTSLVLQLPPDGLVLQRRVAPLGGMYKFGIDLAHHLIDDPCHTLDPWEGSKRCG